MEKILFLNKVPLFEGMTSEQLRIISQICVEEEFLQGETIIEQGDLGDKMYIIVDGDVDIFKENEEGKQVYITTVKGGEGGIFGEMATITDHTRNATVKANTDVRTLAIPKDEFREIIREYPELSFEIFRVLVKKQDDTNRLVEMYIQQGVMTDQQKSG